MRHYEKVTIETSRQTKITCDFCGAEKIEPFGHWPNEHGTSHCIAVRHSFFSSPYTHGTTSIELDVCPTCFGTHIIGKGREMGRTLSYKTEGFPTAEELQAIFGPATPEPEGKT